MARTQYTVTFPAAKAGDEVIWPNTVKVYPDASTSRPLGNGYIETAAGSFTGWSDAASVTFTRAGTSDSVTVTTGSPTGTGAAVPSAASGASSTPALAGYDIVLLAGQSNMAGYTGATTWDYQHADPYDKDIWQYASGAITLASDPLSHPDPVGPVAVGPGMAFARWWASINPGRRVLLVPYGYGGTALTNGAGGLPNTWDPASGAGSLYLRAIAAANGAIAAAQAIAPTSKVVAFLWHQGEADSWSSVSGATYSAKLDALIDGFRASVTGATATTPFILGRMVPDYVGNVSAGTEPAIDAVHADTPRRKAHTWVASGAEGMNRGDPNLFHYTAAGQRIMGQRMFFALTNATANTAPSGIVPDPPSFVTTVQSGTTAVIVNWLPATSNATITGYEVWKGTASGGETLLTTLGNVTTYTDSAVSNGTTYFYYVKAINAAGTSVKSGESQLAFTVQTLIAADNFNRADTNTGTSVCDLGVTSTGALAWTYGTGFVQRISSNQAWLWGATAGGLCVPYLDAGTPNTDQTVTYTTTSFTDRPGLIARYVDLNNYITFEARDGTRYELDKWIAGVDTRLMPVSLGDPITAVPTSGDVMRMVTKVIGGTTQITCYVNGVQIFQISDSTISQTSTKVGPKVNGNSSNTFFDNYSLYTAP